VRRGIFHNQETSNSRMTTPILGRPDVVFQAPYDFGAANKQYVAEFSPSPDDLTRGPRSRTAIITCVDGRTIPEMFFQLKPNEAWSIRNGGGRANDPSTIRTLMTIQAFSELKEVKVVHHKSKYSPPVSLLHFPIPAPPPDFS
jgi:carbonic anhydrase